MQVKYARESSQEQDVAKQADEARKAEDLRRNNIELVEIQVCRTLAAEPVPIYYILFLDSILP
jgi:hypothetical protein